MTEQKLRVPWITDRPPAEMDGDLRGRVLVADPMNDRVRVVPIFCANHFDGWFPLAAISPEVP